jgi:hypothetical protein
MIGRTLARRLEDLEAELLPVVGETKTIRVDFVEPDGTITIHMDFTINLPAPQPQRTRSWRRKWFPIFNVNGHFRVVAATSGLPATRRCSRLQAPPAH